MAYSMERTNSRREGSVSILKAFPFNRARQKSPTHKTDTKEPMRYHRLTDIDCDCDCECEMNPASWCWGGRGRDLDCMIVTDDCRRVDLNRRMKKTKNVSQSVESSPILTAKYPTSHSHPTSTRRYILSIVCNLVPRG